MNEKCYAFKSQAWEAKRGERAIIFITGYRQHPFVWGDKSQPVWPSTSHRAQLLAKGIDSTLSHIALPCDIPSCCITFTEIYVHRNFILPLYLKYLVNNTIIIACKLYIGYEILLLEPVKKKLSFQWIKKDQS